MQQSITLKQANRIADEYVKKGREALSPHAELTNPSNDDRMACTNSLTGKATTFSAIRDYQVVGLPSNDPHVYFEKLREWWPDHGFHVSDDNTDLADGPSLSAEHLRNGFAMTLFHNDKGEFYLTVSSPCVPPGGTAD
jgi:hypothetical protein